MSPDQLQPALIIRISISTWRVLVWQRKTNTNYGTDGNFELPTQSKFQFISHISAILVLVIISRLFS